MRYTVVWDEDAEAYLAEMWFAARDRLRLNEASARLEDWLARAPH